MSEPNEHEEVARIPDCLKCRGACCEDLVFPEKGLHATSREFFRVRCGDAVPLAAKERGFVLPLRCPKLSDDGLCTIYEERPMVCALYIAGGDACLATLRRRRPQQMAWIMGERDWP